MNDFIEIDLPNQKAIIRKSSINYINVFQKNPTDPNDIFYIAISLSEQPNNLNLVFRNKDEAFKEYERLKKLIS